MNQDLFIVEWAVADPLATNHELLTLTGNKPDPSQTLVILKAAFMIEDFTVTA
jgi:hypothetical protein